VSSARATTRTTAGIVGAALLVGGGAAVVQARESAAAQEAERRAAQQELDRDVTALRTDLAAPAHVAERAANDLLVAVVESVTGSERDADAVRATLETLVADLRAAADELDEAAAGELPDRPEALPVQAADDVFGRLEDVETRAATVADELRRTADRAEAFATAAHDLTSAASAYAAATADLPDSDDPDTLATAWRAERERLAAYAEAVEAAGGIEGLEELAGSHGELVDVMRTLADDAVAALEAGDIDGYNARLAEALDGGLAGSLGDDLVGATEAALGAATVDELQRTREAVLELLLDLEDLRRVTGPSADWTAAG
jgi:hypothetical protein